MVIALPANLKSFLPIPVGAMRIDEEIYKELNASKYAVKVPQALGGGRMALFETIHQIHYVVSYSTSRAQPLFTL